MGLCRSRRTRLGLFVRGVTQNRPDGVLRGREHRTHRHLCLRAGLRHRRAWLAGAEPDRQRGPDLGQNYIVDSLHGGGAGRRRPAGGHGLWRPRPGLATSCSKAGPARCWPRSGAGVHHHLHPEASAGHLRAQGPPADPEAITMRTPLLAGPGRHRLPAAASPLAILLRRRGWSDAFMVVAHPALPCCQPAAGQPVSTSATTCVGAARQDHVLRHLRAGDGPDLGLHRHPEPGPRPVLSRSAATPDGHVPDAPDRRATAATRATCPDFMVFLDWKELPWHWAWRQLSWPRCCWIVLVPGLVALRVRLLRLPLAHQGVYSRSSPRR